VAVAGFAAAPWLQDGVLVVSTTPPGAQITVDGRPVAGTSPVVVEGVRLSGGHRVEAALPGHRPASVDLGSEPGRLVRAVQLTLTSTAGAIQVESTPPGAEVRMDGKLLGRTPLAIPGVAMDERHRIDLSLPGHDVDQFVVLPEKDGTRFVRRLSPLR
jgi:hypothetical protein